MTVRYDEAMHHAYAGKNYGTRGPNYEDIVWNDTDPKPTQAELEAIWDSIKDEVALRDILRERAMNYPGTTELIVAMWEKLVSTDGLSDPTIAAIEARRQQVKADFPKP